MLSETPSKKRAKERWGKKRGKKGGWVKILKILKNHEQSMKNKENPRKITKIREKS